MSELVVFDFDGTLTCRDTTRDLLLILLRQRPLRLLAALPWLCALMLARSDPDRLQSAKCGALGSLLRGLAPADLGPVVERFRNRVLPLLRQTVWASLRAHQRRGVRVLVVTASPRIAIEPVLAFAGILVIGTEFSESAGRFTGRIAGAPCYGTAKVDAIYNWLALTGASGPISEAWSDSLSDGPMMDLAARRVWVTSEGAADDFRTRDPQAEIVLGD